MFGKGRQDYFCAFSHFPTIAAKVFCCSGVEMCLYLDSSVNVIGKAVLQTDKRGNLGISVATII